jgi:hypothetical protein
MIDLVVSNVGSVYGTGGSMMSSSRIYRHADKDGAGREIGKWSVNEDCAAESCKTVAAT